MIIGILGCLVLLALCLLLVHCAPRETTAPRPERPGSARRPLGLRSLRRPQRLRRRPKELRVDWWSRFEQDLREYERRRAREARRKRRSQDWPPPR